MDLQDITTLIILIFAVSLIVSAGNKIISMNKKVINIFDYVQEQQSDIDAVYRAMYEKAKAAGHSCTFGSDVNYYAGRKHGASDSTTVAVILSEIEKHYHPDQEETNTK